MSGRKKKSFLFTGQAMGALDAVQPLRQGRSNATHVLHYALTAYRELVDQRAAGATIVIRKGGRVWPYSPRTPLAYEQCGLERPQFKEEKKKRSFEFDEDGVEALEAIRARTGSKTEIEVLEAAISVYYELLLLDANGFTIVITDKHGDVWRYDPHAPLERTPYTYQGTVVPIGEEVREQIM